MALKAKREVKHVLLHGSIEQLDVQLTNYVNLGWDVLDVKIILFDAYNQVVQILYILGKKVNDVD